MLRYVAGGVAVLFLVTGCASKQEKELTEMYKSKAKYHKTLLKTEKVLFKNDRNMTELSVVTTYLDPGNTENLSLTSEDQNLITSFFGLLKPKDREKEKRTPERFIIGLYSDVLDIDHITSSDIRFYLNKKKPKSITPVSAKDKRLKHFSFVTPWYTYYLVTFPHSKSERMLLTVSLRDQNKTMFFTKRAKYIYTRRAFD